MSEAGSGGDGAAIAALNAGSSSLKFALFTAEAEPREIARDEIDHIDPSQPDALLPAIEKRLDGRRLAAVGHRIVHGGAEFFAPTRVTAAVLESLTALTPLAPLHQPLGLAPIRALLKGRPDLPQVACFDTAFHHGLNPPVSRYAIPRRYEEAGVRKYGFHGLSYSYIARRLGELGPHLLARKTVVAHLGSGASLCAMQDGVSVDTTMGFSALDGLVMGTRPGAIDPGVLLWLLREEKLSADALEDLLYHKSGMLGVSGVSGDMQALLASADPKAMEAVDLFAFSISRQIAAMANSLDGLELIVFTGGIGEHAPEVRAMVASRLRWLGVLIDAEANVENAGRIDDPHSAVELRVIATDEELMIARGTAQVLAGTREAKVRG